MNGTPTQQTLGGTTAGGQTWNPPWSADATRDATLQNLRNAYPKSTTFGQSINPEMAFYMVRGQSGFVPATSPPLTDNEADGLMYCRWNWAKF